METNKKVFRLGIAMAGAVSAGAYTAGVIDYLLETLQRWQEAKDKNRSLGKDHPEYDPSIPMHDVVIDVMGGSSAGGMTAAITALSMFEGVNLKEWDPNKKKLYDSWVNLNDNQSNQSTLEQMLESDDIIAADELPSILNSGPIDQIADRARNISNSDNLPPYIAKDMEIILTITSIRGIPISVNFFDTVKNKKDKNALGSSNDSQEKLPAHKMYVHKGVAHFQFDLEQKGTPSYTVPFHPKQDWAVDLLLDCAKATGAFPIGLKARKLEGIQLGYVKSMIYRMFGIDPEEDKNMKAGIEINTESNPFNLVAVDGGTVNNEPFGEIIRALEERCPDDDGMHAVLMIDPFPNFETVEPTDAEISHPSNVIDLIPSLLGAIRAQAMVKEREIVRGLSSDYSRKMIFPKKEGDPFPIACGSLDGFGGFFSKAFREHDYKLGRRNCQRFLRKHLSIQVDHAKDHPLFKDWNQDGSDARHNRFFVKRGEDIMAGAYPIIPDLGIESMSRGLFYDPYDLEPDKPQIDPQEIFALDQKIQKRLQKVLIYLFKTNKQTVDHYNEETRTYVSGLMDAHFKKGSWLSRLLMRLGMRLWRSTGTRIAAQTLSKKVIGEILLDFKKRNLIK